MAQLIRLMILLVFGGLLTSAGLAAELMAADIAAAKSKSGAIVLIDIRQPDEWAQSGVAVNAHKISMHRPGFLESLSKLVDGKRGTPVALICATGARSTWLSQELEKRGYTNIINVREGMMGSEFGPGWLRRGLPTKPHG